MSLRKALSGFVVVGFLGLVLVVGGGREVNEVAGVVVAPQVVLPGVVEASTFGDLGVGVREGILAAMRVARVGVDAGSLVLEDRVERIVATVGVSGTVVEGRDGARVGFSGARLGRDGGLVELRGGVPVGVDTSVVSLDRVAGGVAVREWWRHGVLGIEQGFTVGSRPGGTGLLRVQQTVSSSLMAEVVDGGLGLRFVDGGGGERLRFGGLVAFDAVGRDLVAVMVVDGDDVSFVVDDRDAVFPVVIDPVWSQQVYLKASNTDAYDEFGYSVAVSGDTVVVGARGEDSNATGVNGDQSNNASTNAGAAYVFVRTDGVWSQQAYLKASNTDGGDLFGESVAVSGDTVVVGARGEASNATGVNGNQDNNVSNYAGAAYVFVRTDGVWSQQAYLKASNTDTGDEFGRSVAVSGDTVVVGALFEDSIANNSGAAYVFARTGGVWSEEVFLKASNAGVSDEFGYSVAVTGDTAVVGAPSERSLDGTEVDNSGSGSGAAYVFVRTGASWAQQRYLKASNIGSSGFGYSVAVTGDTVVVGAPFEGSAVTGVSNSAQPGHSNSGANSSGAAYVFARAGVSWSQQAYLKASNTDTNDRFGDSVAMSGVRVVVGAILESSDATGVNGDQSNNASTNAGAAYVFARTGGSWAQQAYLKASNTGAQDLFGDSVAVSGDTVVVGARRESSNSTGVSTSAQAGQGNNGADNSGAAYVMELPVVVNPELVPPSPVLPPGVAGLVTEPVVTVPPVTLVPPSTLVPPVTTVPSSTVVPVVVGVVAPGSVLTVIGDGSVVDGNVGVDVVGDSTLVTVRNSNGTSVVLDYETALTGAGSGVLRGRLVTVTGGGFQGDTEVDLWLNSSPLLLGSMVTAGDGSFVFEVVIPGGVELGAHVLRVEGVGPGGVGQSTMLGITLVDVLGDRLPATGVSLLIGWALFVSVVGVVVLVGGGRRRGGSVLVR